MIISDQEPENTNSNETETDNDIIAGADELPSKCTACLSELEEFYYFGEKHGFSLIGCIQCGTVVIAPMLTTELLKKYHDEYKEPIKYGAKRLKKIADAKKAIEKIVPLVKGKRFLDIGCSSGFAVSAAQELGLDAKGIDIDPLAIEYAKNNFGEVHFETIDIDKYAEEDNQADIIYCSGVIDRMIDPEAFVASLKKILAPNGVIYLTALDGNHFMIPANFPKWKAVAPLEHMFYFSKKGLETMFERNGLAVKKSFFNFRPIVRMVFSHSKKKNVEQ